MNKKLIFEKQETCQLRH